MKAVTRGDIYHRYFTTTKPPKYKFVIIIGEDEKDYAGYFFINSNENKYVAQNKDMHNMQMPLKPEDYRFLDHVSFVAGHELSKIPKSDLIDELSRNVTQFKGRMFDDDMERLLDAARNSPLFSPFEKDYFK